MKAIDLPKNTVATKWQWQYDPILSTGDTSSFNDLVSGSYTLSTTTASSSDVGDRMTNEIQRRLDQIYKEREENIMRMNGIKFNDLEKELRKLGIELSTIRHSSGDIGCEIEGYLNPEVYKIHRAKEMCSVPITPKKPLPKKVIFNGPATTILWKDGTKTTVKCSSEDVWDDDVGIAMCYLKKMLGNKGNYNNIFREAMKVAEVQTKKEELTSSTAIEGESYYSSALDSMKRNIDEINDFMKDAADALDKALGGKK